MTRVVLKTGVPTMASGGKRTRSAAAAIVSRAVKRARQTSIGKWVGKAARSAPVRRAASAAMSAVSSGLSASLTSRRTQYVTIKPGGATTSLFSHKSPCPKYMKQVFKEMSPQVYVSNSGNRTTTVTGQQGNGWYLCLQASGVAGDYTSTTSDMPAILNQIYGGAATGAQKTGRLYFKSVQQNLMLTNNQTNNCFVDIYDVVAKRDGNQGIAGSWHQGLIDQGMSVGAVGINIVPTMSTTFNQHWKVLKKTSIELGPGVSHRHISSIKFNKAFNAERLQDASVQFGGLTTGIMYVFWGAPDHDATSVTAVSTGSALIDAVYSKQIMYTYAQPQQTATKYLSGLGTITTERAVNPESGAPGTVAS